MVHSAGGGGGAGGDGGTLEFFLKRVSGVCVGDGGQNGEGRGQGRRKWREVKGMESERGAWFPSAARRTGLLVVASGRVALIGRDSGVASNIVVQR